MRFHLGGRLIVAGTVALAAMVGLGGAVMAFGDFGSSQEADLAAKSQRLFGVIKPVDGSSTSQISAAQASADPTKLVTLAKGLKARVVTAGVAGPNIDMMGLWPNDQDPEYIIACNEQGVSEPGLQRINIETGAVETILTGTKSCDPVHVTDWGTVVFGEEAGGGSNGGRVYELIDPVNTTGVTLDRTTGTFSGGVGAGNFAVRPALGRNSFEGVAIYPNGIVYYGDENRPSAGTPGGAYFKFVPSALRDTDSGPITDLADSPLVSGDVYGLRLGLRSGGTDYGQGTQTGLGTWVAIDLQALDDGNVRFCGNNTGNEENDQNWGETICITDGSVAEAAANSATPEVQYLVMGNPEYNMPDNIAYQPGTGNWVVHEDADNTFGAPHNNDLWDCLDDGADANLQSDGCIRAGTLNDMTAEWTGGLFDGTGKRFFVSVQHNISGAGTVLEITGWDVNGNKGQGHSHGHGFGFGCGHH